MQMFSSLKDRFRAFFSDRASGEKGAVLPRSFLLWINILLGAVFVCSLPFGVLLSEAFDLLFIFVLLFLLSLYRPGWTFLLLIGSLPYETVNLTGALPGIMLRPYQFLAAVLALSLAALFIRKRSPVRMFPWRWFDTGLVLFLAGGFLASVSAPDPGISFRLAVILVSFFLVYFLGRIFIRDSSDLPVLAPFFLSSTLLVVAYGVFQNLRFLFGFDPMEVMPGRPNATFSEPDWLGGFLVVAVAVMFLVIMLRGERKRLIFPIVALSMIFLALLLSVSRSAWLGACAAGIVAFFCLFSLTRNEWRRAVFRWLGAVSMAFLVALSIAPFLTHFDLFDRAASTAGLQEITVSCVAEVALPGAIADLSDLNAYGCRHIDLEEIGTERIAGHFISTVDRPDPNVEIRKDIYAVSLEKTREHPVLGIGWGSIGTYLGTDGRGAVLNASNLFLEVWLGSGLLGILGFLSIWIAIPIFATRKLLRFPAYESSSVHHLEARLPSEAVLPVLVLSAWAGLTVFNLFNSGVLLGHFWIFLTIATLVLERKRPDSKAGN